MTNDKLPEETQEQISKDADEYARTFSGTRSIKRPYIAGATAWAGWKVRFDELQARCDKMAQLLYMLQSVHSHEWSEGNKENVKQTLQQWQQFKDGNRVGPKVCTCSVAFLAAHGECYYCPGKHTKLTNPK